MKCVNKTYGLNMLGKDRETKDYAQEEKLSDGLYQTILKIFGHMGCMGEELLTTSISSKKWRVKWVEAVLFYVAGRGLLGDHAKSMDLLEAQAKTMLPWHLVRKHPFECKYYFEF